MKLKDLKSNYSGRVFLIGNGPSLNNTPLELLQEEYTFAANCIPDIFSETDWRPSFYACVDDGVDIKYCEECIDLGIPCFFSGTASRGTPLVDSVPVKDNTLFFESVDLRDRDDLEISAFQVNPQSITDWHDVWSEEITEVVYGYNTVMYHMMQIAYYIGFDEFYLVGNDLYDVFDKYLFFPEASDPAIYRGQHRSRIRNLLDYLHDSNRPLESLCNWIAYKTCTKLHSCLSGFMGIFDQTHHFSEHYNQDVFLTAEQNQKHIVAHKLAKWVSDQLGFEIYNATVGGHLEVYPRVDIRNVVHDKA